MEITTSRSFALSTWVLFISLVQSVNSAQYVNTTHLLPSSNCFVGSSSPAPAFVLVPFTRMYT